MGDLQVHDGDVHGLVADQGLGLLAAPGLHGSDAQGRKQVGELMHSGSLTPAPIGQQQIQAMCA